jgi:hypothetical protein
MTHTRRSPYEPEMNDGAERNSRKEPKAAAKKKAKKKAKNKK